MADDDGATTGGDGTTDQHTDSTTSGDQNDTAVGDQQQDSGSTDSNKSYTKDELERIVEQRLIRERKKYTGFDDLKKKASEFDKLQDSQKSEAQKLNDQLTAAQVELQGYRVAEIRRQAASAAGLDPELAEFITAADETEAAAQAKRLAERFTKTTEPRPPVDLKQGARPHTQQQPSRDDLLRGLAGYGR